MYNTQDVLQILENPFINQLDNGEYGKMIQSAAEEYIQIMINQLAALEIVLNPTKVQELISEFKYVNNGPGFDRVVITANGKKRLQIKFRQVEGLTPFSRSTHFANTRRHSKKNKGFGDKTGMITYGDNEFDYVLVILCHITKGARKPYSEWSYSLIPIEELKDVNNIGFLMPNIPSDLLFKNKYDNIYMLTNRLQTL